MAGINNNLSTDILSSMIVVVALILLAVILLLLLRKFCLYVKHRFFTTIQIENLEDGGCEDLEDFDHTEELVFFYKYDPENPPPPKESPLIE